MEQLITQSDQKEMQIFLVKPYNHLLIRQDPVYDETYFLLETLTKELELDKEKATSRQFPDAETPEQFLKCIIEDQEFANTPGNKIVARKARRDGWVRIKAPEDITIDELWKMAMQKVGNKEFFNPYKNRS